MITPIKVRDEIPVKIQLSDEADPQRVTDFLRKWTDRFRGMEKAKQEDAGAAA